MTSISRWSSRNVFVVLLGLLACAPEGDRAGSAFVMDPCAFNELAPLAVRGLDDLATDLNSHFGTNSLISDSLLNSTERDFALRPLGEVTDPKAAFSSFYSDTRAMAWSPGPFTILNPYDRLGSWRKANLHMHTAHSDGVRFADEVIEDYRAEGYSILCLSDHNGGGDQDGGVIPNHQVDLAVHDWNLDGQLITNRIIGSGVESYVRDYNQPRPEWAYDQWMRPTGATVSEVPLLIPGFEGNNLSPSYYGAHFVFVGYPVGPVESTRDFVIHRAVQTVHSVEPLGFAFIAHPGRLGPRNPYAVRQFMELVPVEQFDGLEIVNGAYLTKGCAHADATPLWDELLSRGYRLWGVGNDDSHQPPGAGDSYPFTVWSMILSENASTPDVLTALREGAFYVSTGVLFDELRVENGTTIVVSAAQAKHIRFIGMGTPGIILRDVKGSQATYTVKGNEGYVRVEAYNDELPTTEEMFNHLVPKTNAVAWIRSAWSQPFFINNK